MRAGLARVLYAGVRFRASDTHRASITPWLPPSQPTRTFRASGGRRR